MPDSEERPFCITTEGDRVFTKAWLFGVSLDLLLFGILTVQTYVYYLAFPKDRRLLKLAVIWVYLVGAAQTILAMVDLYIAFNSLQVNSCDLFGNKSHFWLTIVAFSAVVALVAQWLYAYRIYVISRKRWVLIFIICLSLGQLGSSIAGCLCLGFNILASLELRGGLQQNPLCSAGFGWIWGPLNFLCDGTITVSMSILLLKRRKGTLKKTTRARITRVVQLVVETGLVTSIVVVLYAVTYNLSPATQTSAFYTVWTIPGLTMGKVYSNSMLALLNSRLTIVGGRNAGDPFGISEVRSEDLLTEVAEDRTTNAVTRRRAPNEENPASA